MKQVSAVFGLRALTDMVNHVADTYREFALTNDVNGDEIMVIPDQPLPGFVTISVVNQQDDEDGDA